MIPERETRHGVLYHVLDVLFNVVIIVVIVAVIRVCLVSPFQVDGMSMLNTLENGQYIIINKLAYLVGKPMRGDVAVLRPPSDYGKFYVKRVIGEPGDRIAIRDGWVYLRKNGEKELRKLEEPYLNDNNLGHTYRHPPSSGDTSEVVYDVPDGYYFVMGDNRKGSLDSRSFLKDSKHPTPFVKESDIKGRVWFVALPITKIHALEPPEYGF